MAEEDLRISQVTLALRILESEWTMAEIVRSIDAPFSGQQSRCPATYRELQRICCLIEDAAGLGFYITRTVAGALRDLDLFTEVTASLHSVTVRDDAPRLGRTIGASVPLMFPTLLVTGTSLHQIPRWVRASVGRIPLGSLLRD